MVTLTPRAVLAVERFVNASECRAAGLRIIISPAGRDRLHCGLRLEQRAQPTDQVIDCGAVKVFIDRESVPLVDDVTIDFVDNRDVSGFRFTNLQRNSSRASGRGASHR